jgi:hypothetical protein
MQNKANPSASLRTSLSRIECCVMRIAKRNLKKQSQFLLYCVLRDEYRVKKTEKTKPK